MATSLDEILVALTDGVIAINELSFAIATGGNSFAAGNVTAINTLSTTPLSLIGEDQARRVLLFHNPSSAIAVLVAPTLSASGAFLTPTSTAPGGSFLILPQDYLQFSGGCQSGWNGVSLSGSGNPLTVVSF